jgi:uptake hydrogenase large subunit
MTDPAGKLHITLDPAAVTITSSRPVRAAKVFVGRDVADTVRLLPVLFNICGTAQSAAAAAAIEQALGLAPDHGVAELRRHLVDTETLREHLWRILLDWPKFLGDDPDAAAMTQAMRLTIARRTALAAGSAALAPGASAAAPDQPAAEQARADLSALCTERLFGVTPAVWRTRVDRLDTLAAWAADTDTVAARLVRQVIAAGQAGYGRCAVSALPGLSAADLDRHLGDDAATTDDFVARPIWAAQPRETSPLTRQQDQPLVRNLATDFANGLLPRLVAQLTEVARLLSDSQGPAAQPAPAVLPPGQGLSQVQAARGLLVHRVHIRDGRIAAYAILAPTEWNFHPRGVVAAGLQQLLRQHGPDRIAPLARLFIAAVDPCVDYTLDLPGSDPALQHADAARNPTS